MEGVTPEHLDDRIRVHELERPHEAADTSALLARLDECEARIAVLEAEAHRHEEYAEDDGIEVVEE